jgi:hypothetical protein
MDRLQRDLRILLAVGHPEWYADAIQYAVQVHLFGQGHELVDVRGAPAREGSVTGYREAAFLFQSALPHITPVVVGASDHVAVETRFEGHRLRAAEVAQGHALHGDAPGNDVAAGSARWQFSPDIEASGEGLQRHW